MELSEVKISPKAEATGLFRRSNVIKEEKEEIDSLDELKKEADVSIPGMGRLCDPSYGKCAKSVWLILIILCSGVCVFLTVDRLTEYFAYPKTTIVEVNRKTAVKFPSFSVCSTKLLYGLEELVESELLKKCNRMKNGCKQPINSLKLKEMNISLQDLWRENEMTNITAYISKSTPPSLDLKRKDLVADVVLSKTDSMGGSCVIVTHTEEIPYFSAATSLTVEIVEDELLNNTFHYKFIPHGDESDEVHAFEFLNHEFEILPYGYHTRLKIQHEEFRLLNLSGEPCYDMETEQENVKTCAFDVLQPMMCRFPYLPETFRECETLADIEDEFGDKNFERLQKMRVKCNMRRVCYERRFSISVDYAVPSKNPSQTTLTVKFSDDTSETIAETYTYTFPLLVGDLFAYWGFFLCLSALVIFEVMEYMVKRVYQWAVQLISREN